MNSNSYLWHQILFIFSNLEKYLDEQSSIHPTADWIPYVQYVHNVHQQTVKDAIDPSEQNIYSTLSSIAGLSRYRDEFFWKSDTEVAVSKYLNELAKLRVKLLEVYNL